MYKYSKDNLGEFVEKDYGKTFTYRKNTGYNPYNLEHEVDVLDGYRYATVKKTRAYVVVDEDTEGNPVFETWVLKKHTVYEK